MNGSSPLPGPPASSWLDKLQALVEVLLLSGMLSSVLAALPFSGRTGSGEILMRSARVVSGFLLLEALITLTFLMLILRSHRETLGDFGLRRVKWASHLVAGLAMVPILFLVNALVGEMFRVALPGYYMKRNPLIELIRTPQDLSLFLASALFAGGFKEEVQRAFILTRFRDHLGGATLGLLLWSAAFAAGHYVQGPQGMMSAGLFGLLFGVIYLARGSLIAPMVAHGAYDAVALLGYWFFKGAGR